MTSVQASMLRQIVCSPSTLLIPSILFFFTYFCLPFFLFARAMRRKMVVSTRQRHYVEWFVLVSPATPSRIKGNEVLISRQGLGNAAVEVLLREGKITAVPEDLSRFTCSVNSCESLTARTKGIIVMQLINPTIHWSRRFQAIAKFLFWLDFSERIRRRTPGDIASGEFIFKKAIRAIGDPKVHTIQSLCHEIELAIDNGVNQGHLVELESTSSSTSIR